MARRLRESRLVARAEPPALVRASGPDFSQLLELLFSRYPQWEWATFARFGWRDTPTGLVLTLAAIDPPSGDELDDTVGHVAIQEPYSLRIALGADTHPLAIGVIHSHPRDCHTSASSIDDDMDRYYASYFADFAPDRPYVSLIFAETDDGVHGTGRVHWRGQWHPVHRFPVNGTVVTVDGPSDRSRATAPMERVARLAAAFGQDAAARLQRATVAVVGAGGTGSPAIEVLARAGVGHIIAVDPDCFAESNLERLHGSVDQDIVDRPSKVAIAKRHVASINPKCKLTMLRGRLPQPQVVDALVHADAAIGCTDQQHSRLALSDLAIRYNVPVIDVGVALEGENGHVTGQIVQLIRMLPHDPCALCRKMIHPVRVSQELMSDEERRQRIAAAEQAEARGEKPDGYWLREAQLNTVGYITTAAGALAAGYAIGWIANRFEPPFTRLQMNLSAPFLDVTDADHSPRPDCPCRRIRGWADQSQAEAFITAPMHWPIPAFE